MQIGALTTWAQTTASLSAGTDFTLALRTDGTLWAWGLNTSGQLGDNSTTLRSAPVQITTSTLWTSIAAGTAFSTGMRSDGTIWTWGINGSGQLGDGTTLNRSIAATTSSGLPASYIVSGLAALTGDQLTVTGPGLVIVLAYQPGDSYWQASDVAVQYINAPAPVITGVSVTGVTTTAATLNGVINPNGTLTAAKFQSGTTTAYGTDTPILLSPNNGLTDQSVSTTLTGLSPGGTCHFRITATNAGGTTTTTDLEFTTFSSTADLSALSLSAGTLSPAFASGVTSYAASVSNPTSTVIVTPTVAFPGATVLVRVNGGTYGSASNPQALAVGVNAVDVQVTSSDTLTTKVYSVAVTRRTPYEDWALAHGLTGPDSGLAADFDLDGSSNLKEWGFGTNPASGVSGVISVSGATLLARGEPTTVMMVSGSGIEPFAVFGRRIDYLSVGLTYEVEFSGDFSNWDTSLVAPSVLAADSEIQAVAVPYPPFVNGRPARFFRVRISTP